MMNTRQIFMLYGSLLSLLLFPPLAAYAQSEQSAIASAHPLATSAGLNILDKGGNAFDAAIAVSSVLGVVEPMSSGLGGGGFWLLHRESDQLQIMIDSREKAPAAATENMYLDAQENVIPGLSTNGAKAAAIPGVPAAMVHLAKKYGRLPLRESLQEAIRIAENGFTVYPRFRRLLQFRAAKLNEAAKSVFLNKVSEVPAVGSIIKQKELAGSLRRLAIGGHAGFYQGETAEKMVKSIQQAGGIWTMSDLMNYQIVERPPVIGEYNGSKIISAALPSSGGILLVEMLNILSGFDLDAMTPVMRKQKIIESMRIAYRDRAEFLGDADFIKVNQAQLTSMEYAVQVRKGITNTATPSAFLPDSPLSEGEDTTHFSIVDKEGNRVAATLSINYPFGSGMVAAGTGVVLNNEMDDFSASPGIENSFGLIGSTANAIEGSKRPLSSMSPTFIESNGRTLVIGTPGGSRIISMVLIAILEFMHDKGTLSDWVSTGRYHHQFHPDVVKFERDSLTHDQQQALQQLGYELKEINRKYGNMMAVLRDNSNGKLEAVSDPRWQGYAEVRD